MAHRQELIDALKGKIELNPTVDGHIRLGVLTTAHKILTRGHDRHAFIVGMNKYSLSGGRTVREAVAEIGEMPEFREWID